MKNKSSRLNSKLQKKSKPRNLVTDLLLLLSICVLIGNFFFFLIYLRSRTPSPQTQETTPLLDFKKKLPEHNLNLRLNDLKRSYGIVNLATPTNDKKTSSLSRNENTTPNICQMKTGLLKLTQDFHREDINEEGESVIDYDLLKAIQVVNKPIEEKLQQMANYKLPEIDKILDKVLLFYRYFSVNLDDIFEDKETTEYKKVFNERESLQLIDLTNKPTVLVSLYGFLNSIIGVMNGKETPESSQSIVMIDTCFRDWNKDMVNFETREEQLKVWNRTLDCLEFDYTETFCEEL